MNKNEDQSNLSKSQFYTRNNNILLDINKHESLINTKL